MAEFTPTTDVVRERYWLATVNDTDFPGVEGYADERHTEFDRWLAEVRREAAEKAWDEGYEAGWHDSAENEQRIQMRDWWSDPLTTPNPYRATLAGSGERSGECPECGDAMCRCGIDWTAPVVPDSAGVREPCGCAWCCASNAPGVMPGAGHDICPAQKDRAIVRPTGQEES